MNQIEFIGFDGSFKIKQPENYSYLYLPIAGEAGIKSAITPNLGGDIKWNQNIFLMEPVSAESLHNKRSGRNFWCITEKNECWSAVGASAEAENDKFTKMQDASELTAGLMWQTVHRESSRYSLAADVTSFVPYNSDVELMHVIITNIADVPRTIIPITSIPVFGRSAENIRDHRHVTALLHKISVDKYGVRIKPTMSFDERGHQKNETLYYVYGVTGQGKSPDCFYPTVESFIGEGGSYTHPQSVYHNEICTGCRMGAEFAGTEAVGAIQFSPVALKPRESVSFTIIAGISTKEMNCNNIICKYDSSEKVQKLLDETKKYWQKKVNIKYHTGNDRFDLYMRWISFQPVLRRIYGCSFLPYHDYGKGGRGWRDLWQDCLALLIMNPEGVREMILNYFGGVRIDGTNATIIGEKPREFIADRNHITRVWMDHGYWPFLTTKLYLDQTGDIRLLDEEVPYFKDKQVSRGETVDELWDHQYGTRQRQENNKIYYGTVLEHLLVQNLCAFYEVGEHNYMRLRGADWNDAIDMAEKRGESVAFNCAYAGNFLELVKYLKKYQEITGETTVLLAREMLILLDKDRGTYNSVERKRKLLYRYTSSCHHNLSGKRAKVELTVLIESLECKADWMIEHIRTSEWVCDKEGNGWFNSYYDNDGKQVEGLIADKVQMMLTGQVFSIMSGVADEEQVGSIVKSADKYLYDKNCGGYRLNTDFGELKMNFGRMSGFAYGEKENGAVFSHMSVMYAYALYQRGYVQEGYKALQSLADTAMDFENSRSYPGIPEYFNPRGRGMYHYLTGAASWYMLTMITQVYGVHGELGNLCIEPKLLGSQFDKKGTAAIEVPFAGHKFHISYQNTEHLSYGEYKIGSVLRNNQELEVTTSDDKIVLSVKEIAKLLKDVSCILMITLQKK